LNSTPSAMTAHAVQSQSAGDREAKGGEAEAGPENISGEEVNAHSNKEATPTALITQEEPL